MFPRFAIGNRLEDQGGDLGPVGAELRLESGEGCGRRDGRLGKGHRQPGRTIRSRRNPSSLDARASAATSSAWPGAPAGTSAPPGAVADASLRLATISGAKPTILSTFSRSA